MKKVEGLSYKRVSGLLERLFGVTVSRSALARSLGRLAERGEPSYEILKAQLKAAPLVYPHETGWKIGARNAWLHGATDGTATTVYTIEAGRLYPEAAELLGVDYAGTIASDGSAPYRSFERASRQACLAHPPRRCHELLETARGRSGRYRDPEDWRLVKHLEALQPDPFRFLEQPGLEGTNWPAETELRYAPINRKTCRGGNRTSRRARTQSVLMTIARTTRKRQPDGVRTLAALLRPPHEIVHPALLIASG